MEMDQKKAKILIVDDESVNIDVLIAILKPDYRTIVAKNGEQVFQRLGNQSPPNLILLDIMMPIMDGYEVCSRLKADKKNANIPIIFITAKGETGNVVDGFKMGAVDYITKPFQPEELKARIRTHIKLQQTIAELETALEQIKTLEGMLPICSGCKKIRDDQGYWNQLEVYISSRSNVRFTHGLCPDCIQKLYPDIAESLKNRDEN